MKSGKGDGNSVGNGSGADQRNVSYIHKATRRR